MPAYRKGRASLTGGTSGLDQLSGRTRSRVAAPRTTRPATPPDARRIVTEHQHGQVPPQGAVVGETKALPGRALALERGRDAAQGAIGPGEEHEPDPLRSEPLERAGDPLPGVEIVLGAHGHARVGGGQKRALVDDEVEAPVRRIQEGATLHDVGVDARVDAVVEVREVARTEVEHQRIELHGGHRARARPLQVEQPHPRPRADHERIAVGHPGRIVEQTVARERVGVVGSRCGPPLPEAVVEAEEDVVLEGVEVDLLIRGPARIDARDVVGARGGRRGRGGCGAWIRAVIRGEAPPRRAPGPGPASVARRAAGRPRHWWRAADCWHRRR